MNYDTKAKVLEWLAREPERLFAFCAATGYTNDSLRREIAARSLHLAVLEYLLADESLLMQYCAETGTPPEEPMRAWRALQTARGDA